MSEELVERLRDAFAYESRHYMPDRLYNEAADTIEALTARIAQLEAELAGAWEELRLMSEQLDAANAALLAQERTDD